MHHKIALLAFLVVFYGGWLWFVRLLLVRPLSFFELADRWWGLRPTIADERKFRQRTRIFGIFMLVFVIGHAALMFRSVLTQ